MTKRNLHDDLAICNEALSGPWEYDLEIEVIRCATGARVAQPLTDESEIRFIAEARDGWPHAIERALSSEAEVERLRRIIDRTHTYVQEKWEEVPEREAQIAYCRVLFEIERLEKEE
ncbi:hypothetical protein EEL32_22540 [Brevibacillus laterosporus]|nr:hypothetical protein [Brevibacillus laterosporus]TPG77710.1 hypothetical protein EEL32_22540 [Brevibacillus laterosporus]